MRAQRARMCAGLPACARYALATPVSQEFGVVTVPTTVIGPRVRHCSTVASADNVRVIRLRISGFAIVF